MAYWRSLCNKQPAKTGDYYVADMEGNTYKCAWDGGSFDRGDIVAWLEPDFNQTTDEAYEEYVRFTVDYLLNKQGLTWQSL